MRRSSFIAMMGAALVSVALAGCSSFAPVYGDHAGGGMAAARFNFAPPDNRAEQLILNRLAIAFPGPALPGDPLLKVTAAASSPARPLSDAFDVGRPIDSRVDAQVTIRQGEMVLFQAERFADTSYQSDKLTPVDLASRTGAEEQAARAVAESLRLAILAGYRPAAATLPVR